ncbi:MAG: 16S rRNA (uracil(1498)-N(3))-methyltransferase, partial [Pelagibacteraceae bacterium]|nr:16S rRNA (uracil(1498)-N(3))-methyltransferase [Pelagibacteraceae bacterium]
MTTKIRLYFSDKIQSEIISYLTREQSHYVKDVMRLKTGDSFSVFNDQGEWNAIIENYEKDGARIKILKKVRNKKSEKNVWLAFSPIKQNPLNFMIQ